MIDMHNHLLYGVDDGSDSLSLSLKLLKDAEKEGITDIILTPHYMKNGPYHFDAERIQDLFFPFKNAVQKEVNINFYIGNELYIHSELDTLLLDKKILSLNASEYVLVEFPFHDYKEEYDEYLYNIKVSGYKIIIAHPERYRYVKEDKHFIDRWIQNGYYLQVNQDNLFDAGKKKYIFHWIEQGFVYFVASDAHNENRPCTLTDAYNLIRKQFGIKVATRIFLENPKNVIENKDLEDMPIIKKKFLGIF